MLKDFVILTGKYNYGSLLVLLHNLMHFGIFKLKMAPKFRKKKDLKSLNNPNP